MILRNEYLDQLLNWKDKNVIKAITGIRRCGKSTLLQQYQQCLLERNVQSDQIVYINLEDLYDNSLLDYANLYSYIKERLCEGRTTYIFLDEIQKIDSFPKVIVSLYLTENTDLYITSSNAYMLSSDLATLLNGRYIELSLLPLSFKEYRMTKDSSSLDSLFAEYLQCGGFPYITELDPGSEKTDVYLEGIYNTIIINYMEERQNQKEKYTSQRRVTDLTLLKTMIRYLAGVMGSPVSVKKITDYLISNGRKVSPNTVSIYLEALTESFLFYAVDRFDLIGKQLLKANKKYYIVDPGLRNHVLPHQNYDLNFSIESIVYFELLRRGYQVHIGKCENKEINFIAEKEGILTYFQVTAHLTDQKTLDREMRPFHKIRDNYEKIILTLHRIKLGNYDGIWVMNIVDWLME